MRSGVTFNATAPTSPAVQHSAWHSPVPYLFGGLAAMLGLIAFALLILACSYWKLSGYFESGAGGSGGSSERDPESGDGALKRPPVFEEKILVIMAGQEKPTFLATPASSRASSFNSENGTADQKSAGADGEEVKKQGI
ncbi:protein GLUTAMINE DUMPER 3 [Malania oleifera]|uniref:protein GLUTAMINE DUMPER 3 n=1 Tax=Malania oleifera TaxID=397392 RepID=UPI0025AE94B8|nr:protein GLUTAMINE DUMPER 3 [Malania oleifera]